jgi:serpin B
MSRQPDHYSPTDPAVLLERTKARSTALRRRRLGIGGGASLLVVVALVLGLVLSGGGSAGPGVGDRLTSGLKVGARIGAAQELTVDVARAAKATPRVTGAVARAEVGFSLRLLDQLASADGSGNVLVSPSSLGTALAMLELGATGRTEQQIAATLGTSGLTPLQQAAGWNALMSLLAAETSTSSSSLRTVPQLDVADGLWIQKSFPVELPFVDSLVSEFGSGVWQVDFANDLAGATDALNSWTSQHTHGLITQMFSPGALNALTVLVLADAVYFHAEWQQRFAGHENPGTFYLPSGSTESVQYMSPGSSSQMTVLIGGGRGATAVELPYAGGKLSALVIMPRHRSLPAYARTLTPRSLATLVAGLSKASRDLAMPSFTLASDNKLNNTLMAMGMPLAFLNADFSKMTSAPVDVQTVEQHAYLQVTPQGTTAAAATGVGVLVSSAELPMTINHPFLFLIRDNTSGAILFEAMVENPLG